MIRIVTLPTDERDGYCRCDGSLCNEGKAIVGIYHNEGNLAAPYFYDNISEICLCEKCLEDLREQIDALRILVLTGKDTRSK